MRSLRGSVVVITGASSGIGRATALAFAREGANLVLAARDEPPLREVARQCRERGVRALAVPTDVADPRAVEALARAADEAFEHIDVWVNNAGVLLYGRLDEVPPEAWRRVVETNLFGCVHGARAALARFRARGGGVLVNVSSVAGRAALPLASAYAASKFAVRGLSDALRQELRGTGVSVCTVLPASVDTPIFQTAGNYSGRAGRPIPPVMPPERVARAIVSLARRPRPDRFVGNSGRVFAKLQEAAPWPLRRLLAARTERAQLSGPPVPPTDGNLFRPAAPAPLRGGWRQPRLRRLGRLARAVPSAVLAGLRRGPAGASTPALR